MSPLYSFVFWWSLYILVSARDIEVFLGWITVTITSGFTAGFYCEGAGRKCGCVCVTDLELFLKLIWVSGSFSASFFCEFLRVSLGVSSGVSSSVYSVFPRCFIRCFLQLSALCSLLAGDECSVPGSPGPGGGGGPGGLQQGELLPATWTRTAPLSLILELHLIY